MKMRAAVLYELNAPLVVEEIELDPPKEGELLVKMVASGVCHSDVHYYTGDSARGNDRPVILGHEGAGIVEEVGPRVTVVASFWVTTRSRSLLRCGSAAGVDGKPVHARVTSKCSPALRTSIGPPSSENSTPRSP